MIKLDIEIGDTILTGRFKNKKTTVKSIGKDDHGTPTINGRPILKFRVPKWKQNIFNENTKMNKKQLLENKIRNMVREELLNESKITKSISKLESDIDNIFGDINSEHSGNSEFMDIRRDFTILDSHIQNIKKKLKKAGIK